MHEEIHVLADADFNPRSPDGERPNQQGHVRFTRDFNPRSPDGERLNLTANDFGYAPISIHAPRMGSDIPAGAIFMPTT